MNNISGNDGSSAGSSPFKFGHDLVHIIDSGQDGSRALLPTPAAFTVHIPLNHLKDSKVNHILESKKIAAKTRTHIDSYEVSHYGRIRFDIFGKWRDSLQAGRLLWYSLTKDFTVYIHVSWAEDLEKSLPDQCDIQFKKLYKRVKYKILDEFNLIAVTGPCWDVLKIRKELLRRHKPGEDMDQLYMNSSRYETSAFQILKSLKNDIHDENVHPSESLYYIKSSQLLELLSGVKKKKENLNLEKHKIQPPTPPPPPPPSTIIEPSAILLPSISMFEADMNKLEVIEVPESPGKSQRLTFHDDSFLENIHPEEMNDETGDSDNQVIHSSSLTLGRNEIDDVLNSSLVSLHGSDDNDVIKCAANSLLYGVPYKAQIVSEIIKNAHSLICLLQQTPSSSLNDSVKTVLSELENQMNRIKINEPRCLMSTPLKDLVTKDLIADLCSKSVPKRYSKMRAQLPKKKMEHVFGDMNTTHINTVAMTRSLTPSKLHDNTSPIRLNGSSKHIGLTNSMLNSSTPKSSTPQRKTIFDNSLKFRHDISDSPSPMKNGTIFSSSPCIGPSSPLDSSSPFLIKTPRRLSSVAVRRHLGFNKEAEDDSGKEKFVERLKQLINQAGASSRCDTDQNKKPFNS